MNFTYLLLFNLYICLWTGLYYLFFSKKTTLKFNRFLLLAGIAFSAVLPWIIVPSPSTLVDSTALVTASGGTGMVLSSSGSAPSSHFPLWLVLSGVYWLGVILSGVLFLRKLLKLYRLAGRFRQVSHKGYIHVVIPDHWEVFSFLNFLFAPADIPDSIYKHEQVHIREKHSLDNLLMELLKVICWFNPAIYLYQKALKMIHEYLADASTIRSVDLSEYAQKLVSESFQSADLTLVHPFSHQSHLRKRLTMLQKEGKGKGNLWSYLLLIPALAGAVFFASSFSLRNKLDHTIDKIKPEKVEPQSTKILAVLDTTLTGIIQSTDGTPIGGANILVQGTSHGTITNDNGKFSLNVGPGTILRISRIGYNSITIQVPKNKTISNIVLYPKPESINELYVTGYSKKAVPPPPPPPSSLQAGTRIADTSNVFMFVEQMPQFPGGEAALMKYLRQNIKYPVEAKEQGIQGTVVVQFVISPTGKLKNIRAVTRKQKGGLNEEAIRIVKKMPEWHPGRQNGKKVAVQYSLPIRFMLQGPMEKDTVPLPQAKHAAASSSGQKVFQSVEEMPSFPGGENALMRYLRENIKYPAAARENAVQGTIIVQFIVEKDGSLTNIKTVGNRKGGGLEEEAMRVVKKMPKWIPGKQNNKTVRVQYDLPIRFRLQ